MYSKIYLVDDQDLINTLNTMQFRKLGLEDKVRSYTNPELALDDIRFAKNPQERILVFLDINMPEMTGFEFLEFMMLEEFPTTVEVVIVTSSINPRDREQAKEYSKYVKGFISSPLKLEDIEHFLQMTMKAVV
ncbi:response regulator [Robiginitalea sp. M366]|uniref:response regulator n=1 Tax=Robiginitalea aestuariiviva TaxID=3036903 RepID=UPI00240E44CB|nr:response regulator [Robiginitalea aestuariiviva]MDG1571941.1 response regulator [Robiginitalea aestuariiviva]